MGSPIGIFRASHRRAIPEERGEHSNNFLRFFGLIFREAYRGNGNAYRGAASSRKNRENSEK